MKSQKIKKKQKPLLRFLNICAVVLEIFLVLAVIVISILLVTNHLEKKAAENMTFEEKLEICSGKKKFNEECEILFSSPEIDKECEKLGELRDKCFYKIALTNYNSLYCFEIQNEEIREGCASELMPSEGDGSQ